MPIYTVEIDGKQYDIEGDREPTEQEARQAVGEFGATQQAQPSPQMEQQNVFGKIGNVPAGALRSLLQGKGYTQGAVQPSSVPTFQKLALENPAMNPQAASTSVAKNFMLGLPASTVGLAADMATDPVTMLTFLLGGMGSLTKTAQQARSLKNVIKFDNSLKQATRGKKALDTVRSTLGQAKKLAIQEVAEIPAELSFKGNMSEKVIKAIQNPIYGVELTPEGGVKQTIGNLDKVKEAVGELIGTEKIWEEAPMKELRIVKQFYGKITESMREAAKKAGKPIDKVLDDYHDFMENYRLVNKTLVDTAGQAYGNKLKSAFKFGAEPAYKEAWKEVAKQSPEIKSVMNSMKGRELLKNILKLAGGATAVGLGGREILKRL